MTNLYRSTWHIPCSASPGQTRIPGHCSPNEQVLVVKLPLRPKTTSFESLQISIYSPEVIKKGERQDWASPQSQLFLQNQGLVAPGRAIWHRKLKHKKWNFHGEKKTNKTSGANCLHADSLGLFTVHSFKLKLQVMFCVESLRTAPTHLNTCSCLEIYIFTCWMCKVDDCKLNISTLCHFPGLGQIWWATHQSFAPSEYACSIL